jgi:hypothetical protein
MTRTADGKCTGGVTAADGRHGVLPDGFFSHPALTTVGGALTGLEEQAKRGIPMLSPQSVENLGKAGKYGGPTLGIATALYDTVTAKTYQDACVAALSGTAGVAGGAATGHLSRLERPPWHYQNSLLPSPLVGRCSADRPSVMSAASSVISCVADEGLADRDPLRPVLRDVGNVEHRRAVRGRCVTHERPQNARNPRRVACKHGRSRVRQLRRQRD